MRRVVITGIGAVTPLGFGKDTFWNAIKKGKCGIGLIEKFDTADLSCKMAAEVKDFKADDYLDKKEAKRMDRYTQFAMVATKLAVEDGKIALDQLDHLRGNIGRHPRLWLAGRHPERQCKGRNNRYHLNAAGKRRVEADLCQSEQALRAD